MTSSPAATGRPVAPVIRTVHVGRSPDDTFRLFTEEMGSWWPMATHSVYGEAATVVVEGGEVVEQAPDGRRTVWAEIVESEPAHLLTMRWHPGTDPATPTTVEVRFLADGDGTRVELTHTGWEVLGERAVQARESYDEGWVPVLDRLVAAA
jgi:uncharacterized protein YndB with AHSA1/START domain